MSNIIGQFAQSSPEGVVKAQKGAKFFRNGERFFLTYGNQSQELYISKKSVVKYAYNNAWFPPLKESDISFTTPNETWIKTGEGNNNIGWRRIGAYNSFVRVVTAPISGDILAAYAGSYFTYFLKTNGDLYSAGENYDSQLGIGFTSQRETASLALSDVKKAASGMYSYFGFAIKNDNTIWGAGYGGNGQWGNATSDDYDSWTQITFEGDITGSGNVVDVVCGEYFSVFLMEDNTLWGAGDDLGLGSTPSQIDTNVTKIAGGGYHVLYIKDDDTLWGIGDNGNGQLGTGDYDYHNYDNPVQIDTGVKEIGCGGYHSGYIKNDNTLWMMGANWDGQLGLGDEEDRILSEQVSTNVRSIKCGDSYTMFVKNDDTLWGVGYNGDGQIGVSTNTVLEPTQIDTEVSSVATGYEHTLYVKTDKMLYGMGYNYYYNLGNAVYEAGMYSTNATSGWTAISKNYISIYEEVDRNWKDVIYADGKFVAGGGEGSTVVKYSTDGLVWQTGSIDNVNVGLTGIAYGSGAFVAVSNVADYTNTGVPEVYTSTDGITWITGSLNNTNYNELNGITYGGGLFVAGGDRRIVSSEDGVSWNECTTSYDGYTSRFAYGNNTYVASTGWGNYSNSNIEQYTQSFNGQTVDKIEIKNNSGFVIKDEVLYGCGYNGDGQLGLGGSIYKIVYFLPIASNVRSVASHNSHNTFVKTDDTLWGMGSNYNAELGDGTFVSRYSPIQIDTDVSQSFGGGGAAGTLYIKNDSTLWGMGYNAHGQFGDPATVGYYLTQSIQLDTNVACAAMGEHYILYKKNDNTLWGRGLNNYGQLGTGDTSNRTASIQIASDVVSLAAGAYTSYYITTGSVLYGTGYNGYGQLGLGDLSNRNTPQEISSSVVQVAASYYYTQFITDSAKIYGMGWNAYGQLADGTTTGRTTPVLATVSGALDISCGYSTSYIKKDDGTLYVVGEDNYGVQGRGTIVSKGTYSTDGISWSSSLMPDYYYNDIAFGNGRFVAVADDPLAISSTDGINWTSSYISTGSYVDPSRIIFDGTKFVSLGWYGDNGYDVYTSTDGVSWTLSTTGQNGDWGALAYGDGKYVTLTNGGFGDINPSKQITI
jgi:alpha-tubulin suppressor-like RCC1 family protein